MIPLAISGSVHDTVMLLSPTDPSMTTVDTVGGGVEAIGVETNRMCSHLVHSMKHFLITAHLRYSFGALHIVILACA